MGNPTIDCFEQYSTRHYARYPIVFLLGQGIYIFDDEGKEYIDAMAGYSALNHGHVHPRIFTRLVLQGSQLAVVSNTFYTKQAAELVQKLCEFSRQDKALVMNSGAEAVEPGIKIARKWGYTVKGISGEAEIIVCDGNFHGRTTTIVGFSSNEQFKNNFGPHTPGFKSIPFCDPDALEEAITENTVAFLIEPMQGEGGIIIPPEGALTKCFEVCQKHNVLMIADEIQTGLGRTGKMFACDYDNVKPDMMLLGKSLGGGMLPISAVVGRDDVMGVLEPGDHGSTFGGNPLASAVACEALTVIIREDFPKRSTMMGTHFLNELRRINSPLIKEVRGRGLFCGIEIDDTEVSAKQVCESLLKHGVVTTDAHGVIRLTPPLIITREEITELARRIDMAFCSL